MQLNVLRELRQPLGAVSEYEIDEPVLRVEGKVLKDVRGSLSLLRTDRGLLATFDAKAKEHEQCVRCLVDVTCDVPVRFEEEFVPMINPVTGAAVRVQPGSDVFRIGTDYLLDLDEAIRQYIVMSVPAKPLCREACAGLCPTCGANFNIERCDCEPLDDERWRVLSGLKTKDTEGS